MIGLLITSVLVGFILIGCGFWAKQNPNIIAGYDRLDEFRKKVVPDIVKKSFLRTGLIIILGSFISYFLNCITTLVLLSILPALITCFYVVIKIRNGGR